MRFAILAVLFVATAATAQTGIADVEFDDQESDGTMVTVQQVTLSNGGFVVIHDHRLGMGDAVGSVVGFSDYLEVGTYDDLVVMIDGIDMNETNLTLIAMPHFDSNDNQEYDFVTSAGADDGPYTDTDGAVTDSAEITLTSNGTTNTGTNTVGAGRETEDDNDSPAFGTIALVALLGGAAVLVRRRK